MNKGKLASLIFLLVVGVALAEVYKWVDESGRVHYGDSPPEESNSKSVEIPEGPSQERVERAQQQLQETKDRYQETHEDTETAASQPIPKEEAYTPVVILDNLACFTKLSDLVQVPSAETFTPITPTSLSKAQQELVKNLFAKIGNRWRGTITDLICLGDSLQPGSRVRNLEARTIVATWDKRESLLTIDTDATIKESGIAKHLVQSLYVGDAIYFSDAIYPSNIALDGNKVELLSLSKDMVLFLIKRHVSTGPHTRRPSAEVRHLELAGRKLKFIEAYYHNGILTGSRTWILDR